MDTSLTLTNCPDLNLLNRGKVRDMYAIPGHDDKLLMVASDRISAFDVIMQEPIPGKGRLLTAISLFWFKLLGDIMPNHLISANVDEFPAICQQYRDQLAGRSMLVRKSMDRQIGSSPCSLWLKSCPQSALVECEQRITPSISCT